MILPLVVIVAVWHEHGYSIFRISEYISKCEESTLCQIFSLIGTDLLCSANVIVLNWVNQCVYSTSTVKFPSLFFRTGSDWDTTVLLHYWLIM